jgi:hypothetical protein
MTRILRFSPAPNGAQKTMDGESMTTSDKKAKTRKAAAAETGSAATASKARKARPAAKPAEGKAEAPAKPAAAQYVAPDTTKVPPGIERMRAAREAKFATEREQAPGAVAVTVTPAVPPAQSTAVVADRTLAETVRPAHAPEAQQAPAAKAAPRREPTRAEITERAYELYRQRGMTPGNPEADWLQAERELREELAQLPRSKS